MGKTKFSIRAITENKNRKDREGMEIDPLLLPEKIDIEYWVNDKKYAKRLSIHVPIIGDEVRFNGIAYKVIYRIWIYDEARPRVALNLETLTKEHTDTERQQAIKDAAKFVSKKLRTP